MNILENSAIDINCLKHSIFVNSNGGEFVCTGIGISLNTHKVMVELIDKEGHQYGLDFNDLDDWSIQFHTSSVAQLNSIKF